MGSFFSNLKLFPVWLLLFTLGAIVLILGATEEIVIGNNTIRVGFPANFILIAVGIVFVIVGVLEVKRHAAKESYGSIPIESVSIDAMDIIGPESDLYPRVRVRGKVSPAHSGIRVWIIREQFSKAPGKFHVSAESALTDRNGEWQQFTNLWKGGRFRIYTVVADPDSELLFRYYRQAFVHAREVYRKEISPNSPSFPDWPFLDKLPAKCVSHYSEIVV